MKQSILKQIFFTFLTIITDPFYFLFSTRPRIKGMLDPPPCRNKGGHVPPVPLGSYALAPRNSVMKWRGYANFNNEDFLKLISLSIN